MRGSTRSGRSLFLKRRIAEIFGGLTEARNCQDPASLARRPATMERGCSSGRPAAVSVATQPRGSESRPVGLGAHDPEKPRSRDSRALRSRSRLRQPIRSRAASSGVILATLVCSVLLVLSAPAGGASAGHGNAANHRLVVARARFLPPYFGATVSALTLSSSHGCGSNVSVYQPTNFSARTGVFDLAGNVSLFHCTRGGGRASITAQGGLQNTSGFTVGRNRLFSISARWTLSFHVNMSSTRGRAGTGSDAAKVAITVLVGFADLSGCTGSGGNPCYYYALTQVLAHRVFNGTWSRNVANLTVTASYPSAHMITSHRYALLSMIVVTLSTWTPVSAGPGSSSHAMIQFGGGSGSSQLTRLSLS